MNTVLIVLAAAAALWLVEQSAPANDLPPVQSWYLRAFLANGAQALTALAGAGLWDSWFAGHHLLDLGYLSLGGQVVAGYLVITFIYYWWHRARHGVAPLWRWLHQFHHSPTRIEVITSFYKSPLEIVVNGILSSAILHSLLGLSLSAVGLCVLTTALAELVYHANLKTPRWLGLFFQRPEMHRIHHQRGLHHYNYSDLPLWDMLFGTYRNPAEVRNQTGFPLGNEHRITSLLCGRRLKA